MRTASERTMPRIWGLRKPMARRTATSRGAFAHGHGHGDAADDEQGEGDGDAEHVDVALEVLGDTRRTGR